MTRDQLEATFALQGWEPGLWLGRGAARKGDVVVDTFRTPPHGVKRATMDAKAPRALDGPTKMWQATLGWCADDEEFALIAPLIQKIEACQHETIGFGGAPMRCTECHQLIER